MPRSSKRPVGPLGGETATTTGPGRGVGDGPLEPERAQHAAAERLRRSQSQVEHQSQDRHHLDREIGVARLSAGRGPAWCLSPGERRLVEPERQVAAPAQPCRMRGPVRDAAVPAPSGYSAPPSTRAADNVHRLLTHTHMPGEPHGLQPAQHVRETWPRIGWLVASGTASQRQPRCRRQPFLVQALSAGQRRYSRAGAGGVTSSIASAAAHEGSGNRQRRCRWETSNRDLRPRMQMRPSRVAHRECRRSREPLKKW